MSDSQGARRRPRYDPPRPPSTRPPSSAAAVQHRSHEVFVEIASLQMAKARQKRIRSALQDQVESCTEEIQRIENKIQSLYDEAGLEPNDDTDAPSAASPSGKEGFEYEY
jgi:hypothetical protein